MCNFRKILAGATMAGFLALNVPAAHASPEPDWCTRANKPTHFVICDEPSLWTLDRCEEQLYSEVRQIARRSILRAVAKNEAEWVRRRNQCRTNYDCIIDEYAERISELQEITKSKC